MKKNTSKLVSIRFFSCGYEEYDFSECFINSNDGKKKLPVNVILIEHKKLGNMLINTGCAETLKRNVTQYTKYKLRHKLEFSHKSGIIQQLEKEDTDPLCIRKVLLTHCSPECCGALPLLPKYELISSAQVMCMIKLGQTDNDMLKATMPGKNVPIKAAGVYTGETTLRKYFKWVYDILGDGSVLGVDLKGHTREMMGFFLPEAGIFYAADAAPDESVLEKELVPSEKLLALQADPDDYLLTLTTLRKMYREMPDVRFVFLHSQSVHSEPSINAPFGVSPSA